MTNFRTVGGEIGTVYIGDSSNYNPVGEASTECYDTVAVGQTASSWSWRGYQNIITRYIYAAFFKHSFYSIKIILTVACFEIKIFID